MSARNIYALAQVGYTARGSGKLPPPVRLSDRVIGWRRSTIEALLAKGGAK